LVEIDVRHAVASAIIRITVQNRQDAPMFHRRSQHRAMRRYHRRLGRPHRHLLSGGVLIALGVGLFLKDRGLLDAHDVWLIVPVVLALSGLVKIVWRRSAWSLLHGAFRLAAAGYLYVVIEHVGGWTFAATWPVLLIAVGVLTVAHALFDRRRDEHEEPSW
jgi:hypothetical protein